MATNYEATFKMTNFIDARVKELEDNDGNKEMCVVIPLEKNGLKVEKSGHVYCKLFVNEKTFESGDNNSHYMRLKTNYKHVEKMDSLGYKTPYLGTMRPSFYAGKYQSDARYGYNKKVKNLEG